MILQFHICCAYYTSVLRYIGKSKWSCSVVPNSLWPHGLYSLPGSSIHGIFQARMLELVATSFSRGSSWPRDRTWVSRTAGRLFTIWATRGSPTHIRESLCILLTIISPQPRTVNYIGTQSMFSKCNIHCAFVLVFPVSIKEKYQYIIIPHQFLW